MKYYFNENGIYATDKASDTLGVEISKEQYDRLVSIAKKGAPDDGKEYALTIEGNWEEIKN